MAPKVQLERTYAKTKNAIFRGLRGYNRSRVGKQPWRQIAVSIRDDADVIIGGVCGEVWGGYLFVVGAWLDERVRGQDLASQAMDELESQAKEAGAKRSYVDTFSFQARPFYEKRGYQLFGQLDGYFTNEKRYWLSKTL
jgi:GNAT superfamily N-acetyltransferase